MTENEKSESELSGVNVLFFTKIQDVSANVACRQICIDTKMVNLSLMKAR